MNHMVATMLGVFSLSWGDRSIAEQTMRMNKQWELLAMLLLRKGENVTNEQIMAELWNEDKIENPVGALKNTVYTLRKALKACGGNAKYIIMKNGSYGWNTKEKLTLDVWEFEKAYEAFTSSTADAAQRVELGRQAIRLYTGDLLPALVNRRWVLQYAGRLSQAYIEVVIALSELLLKTTQKNDMEEALALCNRAVLLEPLQEQLYSYMFAAMRQLDMKKAVLNYYPVISNLFYDEVGESLPVDIQQIYLWASEGESRDKEDIHQIQKDLMEPTRDGHPVRGAYGCQYEMFKHIYHTVARSAQRTGNSVVIVLLTLNTVTGRVPTKEETTQEMNVLREVVKNSLRKGDVFSRYSRNQFVVILPMTVAAERAGVEKRLRKCFAFQNTGKDFTLNVDMLELPIS